MRLQEYYNQVAEVAKEYTELDIRGSKSRKSSVILIKGCVINILTRYYGGNTVNVGKVFGNHHSTVIHHLRKHSTRYKYEPEYGMLYDFLSKHVVSSYDNPVNVNALVKIMKRALSA